MDPNVIALAKKCKKAGHEATVCLFRFLYDLDVASRGVDEVFSKRLFRFRMDLRKEIVGT